MKQTVKIALQSAKHDANVLLANGNPKRKLSLGVSNQEYGAKRDESMRTIALSRVALSVALDLLDNHRSLYAGHLRDEFDARMADALEVVDETFTLEAGE